MGIKISTFCCVGAWFVVSKVSNDSNAGKLGNPGSLAAAPLACLQMGKGSPLGQIQNGPQLWREEGMLRKMEEGFETW
jgi:hypothetical protein